MRKVKRICIILKEDENSLFILEFMGQQIGRQVVAVAYSHCQ